MGAATVVVASGGPSPSPALAGALGAERARSVEVLLRARARAWATATVGADSVRASEATGIGAVRVLPVTGPVIVITPVLPVWPAALAAAALEDLAAGCAVSFAPVFDGGLYLLALSPSLTDLPAELAEFDLTGPDVMGQLLRTAERERWEVGLLRAERALRGTDDVRALRADPLTDPELRAALE